MENWILWFLLVGGLVLLVAAGCGYFGWLALQGRDLADLEQEIEGLEVQLAAGQSEEGKDR